MTTNDKPRVGFIGLGAMGSRMAERVRQAGYPLTVYNRSPKATEPFAAHGVAVARTPRALAAGVDVVVSMLFDDAAVRDVLTGDAGVFGAARPGLTVIEMSTVGVDASEVFHARRGRPTSATSTRRSAAARRRRSGGSWSSSSAATRPSSSGAGRCC